MFFEDGLDDLAAKTSGGDVTAAGQLRDRLKPQMTLMAQQIMRRGRGNSPLARRILTEAQRWWEYRGAVSSAFPDNLLTKIADELCDSIIHRLRTKPACVQGTKDTVLM